MRGRPIQLNDGDYLVKNIYTRRRLKASCYSWRGEASEKQERKVNSWMTSVIIVVVVTIMDALGGNHSGIVVALFNQLICQVISCHWERVHRLVIPLCLSCQPIFLLLLSILLEYAYRYQSSLWAAICERLIILYGLMTLSGTLRLSIWRCCKTVTFSSSYLNISITNCEVIIKHVISAI